MSKRSVWCEPSKETRKQILKRDQNQCIFCHSEKALTQAHVFLSRAKGGKGSKENLITSCMACHYFLLDNPIGKTNIEKSKTMLEYAKNYLIHKENIINDKEFIKSLKYQKEYNFEVKTKEAYNIEPRCETCYNLKKVNNNINSIPSYYCILTQDIIAKKRKACERYKELKR